MKNNDIIRKNKKYKQSNSSFNAESKGEQAYTVEFYKNKMRSI